MEKGFLQVKGNKIVDGSGEEILLTGWGLGNWLLPEGYMWLGGSPRFDRPRRIEAVFEELAGKDYMEHFWKIFRRDYIRKEDLAYLAKLGYNSIRIPINWRVLMEEGPGIHWKEDGFSLLKNCLDWCEELGLYAFLDLHGAPGGQTGAKLMIVLTMYRAFLPTRTVGIRLSHSGVNWPHDLEIERLLAAMTF